MVQMNALIDTMHKEAIPAGQWLMREGESGDAMYVIKTGKLEVYVGGSLTRQIGRGGAVGELALLYHMPRSASVKVRNPQPRPSCEIRIANMALSDIFCADHAIVLYCSFECQIVDTK